MPGRWAQPGNRPGRPWPGSGPGQVVRAGRRWPLLAVLAVQAGLSLRLIWSNTAFQDEALYLRAGHLEWAQWLHHAPIPNFPAYFSGAPVIYPPLGALADSVGGLTAARILSLCFMLGVTSLLWATTVRLYGQRAAVLAAALFATLAGTQFLGAFATFDAMALFLLALAVWLGVRAADGQGRTRIALLLACGCALAAADAVKYATALFTPVVLVVVALAVRGRQPGGAWRTGILAVLGSWLVLMAAAIAAGGHQYWLGLETSTLARAGVGRPGERGAPARVRVDQPDPGPGRPRRGAGPPQRRPAGGSCPPSWPPPRCSPRPSRPGSTPRSACRSTWYSAPGSRPSRRATPWPG